VGDIGKVCKAIADGTRRDILEMLRESDLSAGEIASKFNMTKPAISFHLSVLKESGLAVERREGQQIIYSLREDSMLEVVEGFLARICSDTRARREEQKKKRTKSRDTKKESAS
jgi:ArsR family transcriptional regulator, arsenate/arsenite/antimonite-responsive transcriptional repressor